MKQIVNYHHDEPMVTLVRNGLVYVRHDSRSIIFKCTATAAAKFLSRSIYWMRVAYRLAYCGGTYDYATFELEGIHPVTLYMRALAMWKSRKRDRLGRVAASLLSRYKSHVRRCRRSPTTLSEIRAREGLFLDRLELEELGHRRHKLARKRFIPSARDDLHYRGDGSWKSHRRTKYKVYKKRRR